MNEFTTENTREQIAHLLAEAQKAILSDSDPLSFVETQINAASQLLRDLIAETPKEPDYQLARAKRVWVVFMPLVNGASRHGTSIESMVAQHIERLLMA